MRRGLLLLVAALAGCSEMHTMSQLNFAVVPPLSATYLRYHVRSPQGAWSRQFVLGRHDFAELRETHGRPYSLGVTDDRTWMRVGSRPPVEVDGALAMDERREAAWIGMRYGELEPGSRRELESCHKAVCTLVYTPRDGHALWVDVDRVTKRPVSFQWIAQDRAIEVCDQLTWSEVDGALAVASATCSAIVDRVGRETTTWTLMERHDEAETPEWAQVDPKDIVPLSPGREVARFPIADPSRRIYVPVDAGGSELQLVLDTGAAVTVLSRRVFEAAGVVRSPEPPVHVKPPWLPEDTYDAAIVDRLVIGGLELHGVPVLVPRDDAPFASDEAGLLGMDVLSRYVVDVDAPKSTLRIWPRDRFSAAPGQFIDVPYWGASHGAVVVGGAVDEIGPMPVIVDTGAPLNLVIGGIAMHMKHPHHRDDEVVLREDDTASDYATEIDGFHLGPFGLPRMPVLGHDRVPDLPFLDSGEALVGLGVLRHFRFAIDAHHSLVHFAPGPSYYVLSRHGLEIDDRNGAPTITRIVEGQYDWRKPLREGDIVLSVNDRKVTNRTDALLAIASSRPPIRLLLERRGNRLSRVLSPK